MKIQEFQKREIQKSKKHFEIITTFRIGRYKNFVNISII